MIAGIGVDLIEVDRVTMACGKEGFLRKYFTGREIELILKDIRKAADNFAVKEAVAKVLGTGFSTFSPIDIEVLRAPSGKPYITLYGRAEELAREQGITEIHVSISNTKDYATAFAVGERAIPT